MNKNINIDLLRAISIFAVIVIHASMETFYRTPIGSVAWNISNLAYSLTKFCVPIFIMISGFLLIKDKMDFVIFYKKRLLRILPPLIFWSIIFGLITDENIFSYSWIINHFIENPAYFHLWFVYALIGIYFLIPLISIIYFNGKLSLFVIYTVSIFVFACLLPFINILYGVNTNFIAITTLNNFSALLIYPFLAIILKNTAYTKQRMRAAILFFIASAIFIFVSTAITDKALNVASELFYTYTYPPVVIMSASLFYIFINLNFTFTSKQKKVIASISDCTFGIYLFHMVIHIYVIKLLSSLNILEDLHYPFINIFYALFLFLTSYAIISNARKIKFITKIT
ncbi:acyltransferase [Sodalis sp. RH21]|uniref:acyltransferase n=1 Tax=unclassified Sodalis (in: enterobacteria) TaxID=2636512 RepID=UPI0039B54C22